MSIEALGPPIGCSLSKDRETKLLGKTPWDPGAFEELWGEHEPSLRKFIKFHIGNDDQSADQIAAEVHDIVALNLDLARAGNSPGGFHKYVRATAYNKCRHYKRALGRLAPMSSTGAVVEDEEDGLERVEFVPVAPESDDPLILLIRAELYRIFFCALFGSPFPPHEILYFAYVWLIYRVRTYCKPSLFWDDCSEETLSVLAEDFWERYMSMAQVGIHAPDEAEEMRKTMESFRERLARPTDDGRTVGETRLEEYYPTREEAIDAWQDIREEIRDWVQARLPW